MAKKSKHIHEKFALHKAKFRRFKETIFLVPFYGGRPFQLKRHVEFLNRLGFDVVTLSLSFPKVPRLVFSGDFKWGLVYRWRDEINLTLNHFSGDKIVYAFSNPTAGAILAISLRRGSDIRALIADGGPTGTWNESLMAFFEHEQPLKHTWQRFLMSQIARFFINNKWEETLKEALARFPHQFPVLSIQGENDPLISPESCDRVFATHPNILYQKHIIKGCGHLNGLKDFKEEYEQFVGGFLTKTFKTLDTESK